MMLGVGNGNILYRSGVSHLACCAEENVACLRQGYTAHDHDYFPVI